MKFSRYILCLSLLFQVSLQAHHLLEAHDIECNKEFPCPDEIKKRISFWVSIYARHSQNTAVLHDSKNPSIVYSIIDAGPDGCMGGRNRSRVTPAQLERKRIEEMLKSLIEKVSAQNYNLTEEERHTLDYFPEKNLEDLTQALENVRCQSGNKDQFLSGLKRFSIYKNMVAEKLQKNGLSPDIIYLPFVESSYNPVAYSRVGAAGMWQIMPKTARTLGLTVNRQIDERFDPDIATEAAAKYFKQSFRTLETAVTSLGLPNPHDHLGPFVITSYNYGIVGAKNMIQEVGVNFSDALKNYTGKRFKTAVQNFYASFAAARHVASKSSKYFGSIPTSPMPAVKTLLIQKNTPTHTLISNLGIPETELKSLNLALTTRVWSSQGYVPKGYTLKLPDQPGVDWDLKLSQLTPPAPAQKTIESEPIPADDFHYKVKRGDSICGIAKKSGLSCAEFMANNQLTETSTIIPGQLLSLKVQKPELKPELEFIGPPPPTNLAVLEALPAEETAKTFGLGEDYVVSLSKLGQKTLYMITIQSEETLGHYAEWLGLNSPAAIRELNRLNAKSYLNIGKALSLPIQNDEQKVKFEQRRIQYHKLLEDEFNERFEVIGQESYTVKKGDSEHAIAAHFEIPVWLLKRFNPGALGPNLKAKDLLKIPVVRAKDRLQPSSQALRATEN